MTESENNCKCTGKVEKIIVRVPGPQGGKGETGPQGELNPADKEFIAQKAQEATEAATGAENAKNKAEESRGAAESAQNAALASQKAAKSAEDAAAESAAQAEESEGAAGNSATVAANAESGARAAASAAAVSAGEAEKAAGVAGQSKTDAVAAKDAAEVAQAGAETSAASAKDSADKAAAALKDTQAEKNDALAKIDATVTQAKSDIQAQVTAATTQATTATQAATTATQKAAETERSAKDAEASKAAAETAKASAETSAATATEQAGIATEKAEALTEATDALTTLSNDAIRFTAQEKTDAEKYQARKNIAASSAGEVEVLKKQVANLQAQAEGKTFTYVTDATEAYSKDVPEGAYPYAAVKNFGGKTIVWNQQIPKERISFAQTSPASIQDGALAYWQMNVSTQPIKGHQYYIYFNAVGTTDNFKLASVFYGSANSVQSGNGKVVTAENSLNLFRCICTGNVGDDVGCSVSNFNIVDLTKMFGEGNVPTAEEFLQMFPENYYEYNAGELKSAPVNNLKSVGKNIVDLGKLPEKFPNWEKQSDGVYGGDIYSVFSYTKNNHIKVYGGRITVSLDCAKLQESTLTSNYLGVVFVYTDGTESVFHRGMQYPNGDVYPINVYKRCDFTSLAGKDCKEFYFTYVTRENIKIKNIQVEKSSTATDYSPYKEENRAIPQAVLNLEGYGWSAGSAKNWVDWEKKEYHREVASVDLGTLAWTSGTHKLTNGLYFFTSISDGAYTNSDIKTGSILAKYTISKAFYTQTSGEYCFGTTFIYSGQAYLQIKDDAYTKVEDFKKSISGEIFYYELAEPEIIDISNILPDDNLIEVEEGGTITFENSNGDGFRIPVPSEIVYQKKVTTNE